MRKVREYHYRYLTDYTDSPLYPYLSKSSSLKAFMAAAEEHDILPENALLALARRIRQFAVDRSGLLREPIVGQLSFTHRTLHEYLAALEAVEAGAYPTLVKLAADEQWRELIILAAGIATRSQSEQFLKTLLVAGNGDSDQNRHLIFLAIACLETAAEEVDRSGVFAAAASLLPPRNQVEAREVARAGDPIVPLLTPEPDRAEEHILASISALQQIDSPSAMQMLANYAIDAPPAIEKVLVDGLFSTSSETVYARVVLRQFTRLQLRRSSIANLEPLREVRNLHTLDLTSTAVTHLDPLKNLSALSVLNLMNTKVEDLRPLMGLSKLRNLILMNTPVTDLSPISNLQRLELLNLTNTRVTKLEPLSRLSHLSNLNLANSRVSNLGSLNTLSRLSILNLVMTPVTDVSPLAGLRSLTELDLRATSVVDISALANVPNLTILNLARTQVMDVSPLAALQYLSVLVLPAHLDTSEVMTKLKIRNPKLKFEL